ncbi:hypothetical protein [Bradyrhizobium sp.]|uniref:hypothetical protein n=1 Tax=Bradyrhizobium sp. TaxID=376 RepID=UPI0025C60F7F|nr:hypothetical protein [Bradyrhizobium sp.]
MSLGTTLLIVASIYGVAAILAFFFNMSIGPVTLGLALLRGALWPLWLMGFIQGQRLPMD